MTNKVNTDIQVGSMVEYRIDADNLPPYYTPCGYGTCMGEVVRIDTTRTEDPEADYNGHFLIKWTNTCYDHNHELADDVDEMEDPDFNPANQPNATFTPDYDNRAEEAREWSDRVSVDEYDQLVRWQYNMPKGTDWVNSYEIVLI